MPEGHLVAFLGVAVLLTITPGADMALVTKHALVHGRDAAFQATLGIITGLVVWAALSAAGLAALLTTSATAFTVLKLVGGAYLIYLGLQTVWQTRQCASGATPNPPTLKSEPVTGWQAYRQGLLSNLLNPKVGIFYTTFLPQFVTPGDPVLPQLAALALVHIIMGLAWLLVYAQLVVTAGDWLRRPRIRCWLDRVTGVVLVGLGLRLALERR